MSSVVVVLLSVLLGAALGGLGLYLVAFSLKKKSDAELTSEREALKNQFAALSQQALAAASEQFLQLARSRLETERERQGADIEEKRKSVETAVKALNDRLKSYEELVRGFEKDRQDKYVTLAEQLRSAAQGTQRLQDTTDKLKSLLSNSRERGQWGEWAAEDLLRLCGLEEGVQYDRNKSQETIGTRPDFIFKLPRGQKLNMDVKFPLDNYERFLSAASEEERTRARKEFLSDVRTKVRDVAKRRYVNPEEGTLDFVLLFIPNEGIYAFLQDIAPDVFKEALAEKVVLSSPANLFALLSMVRRAYDNFRLDQKTEEVVGFIKSFRRDYEIFHERFAKVGELLEKLRKAYDEVDQTSRKRLEQSIARIERAGIEKGSVPDGLESKPVTDESRRSAAPVLPTTDN